MSLFTAKAMMCDHCERYERLDSGMLYHEWQSFRKEGWTRRAGKHFCPSCKEKKEDADGR
jgi:hypothetical protein